MRTPDSAQRVPGVEIPDDALGSRVFLLFPAASITASLGSAVRPEAPRSTMKIRELVESSATCDTRGRSCLMTAGPTAGRPSTSIDADLHSAAAELLRLRVRSLLVEDSGDVVGVLSAHDLLRAALADGDRQLCNDLGDHLIEMGEQHVAVDR